MMTSIDPRPALAALLGALLAASTPALADEVRDASKLLRAGQHQQALEGVNKALSAKPKDAQARFLKGLIYAEQGNAKDATDIFLQLTKDYPDLPEPYNNLAVIYASQGRYDKARRQRIGAPKSIAVTVDSPKVSIAEGKASVTFRQGYRSDVIKSTTATKTLVLAQSDGRWRILYEGGA